MTPYEDHKPVYKRRATDARHDRWTTLLLELFAMLLLVLGLGGAFVIGDEKSCRAEQAAAEQVRENMGVQRGR